MNPKEEGRASLAAAAFADYRRLLAALSARAARLGSRDAEAAVQEALRRSVENPKSAAAVQFHFGDNPQGEPEWGPDQLLAWLHGVLQFVVREEQSRMSFHREVAVSLAPEPPATGCDILETIVERETAKLLKECMADLDRQHRNVLELRIAGLKYHEIASRLQLSENVVSLRLSRAIRELTKREAVRRRTERCRRSNCDL